jgi:competence transcription factor ComK
LENIFIFPTHIASSSKVDTIAVCDHEARKVTVIDYNGKVTFMKRLGFKTEIVP